MCEDEENQARSSFLWIFWGVGLIALYILSPVPVLMFVDHHMPQWYTFTEDTLYAPIVYVHDRSQMVRNFYHFHVEILTELYKK